MRIIKAMVPIFALLLLIPLSGFGERGLVPRHIEFSGGSSRLILESGDFSSALSCRLDTVNVDIVFCMDSSKSMDPYIDSIHAGMADFITNLESHGYNYRLGGVPFDDSTNVWDFNASLPGKQMTTSDSTFKYWLNRIGGSLISSDLNEVSLDAICDAIRLYDWRPEALRIIIMFTNEGYHYLGDETIWSDETIEGTRGLVFSTGTIVFVAASSRPYPSTPIPPAHLQNYKELAWDSGGEWYPLSTSWSVIFNDVVSFIGTYMAVSTYIINATGAPATISAFLVASDPGCVTLHSTNPLVSPSPVPAGDSFYVFWKVIIDSACVGLDRCFDIAISSDGYSDTVHGCTTDDSCFGIVALSQNHTLPTITAGCTNVYPNPFTLTVGVRNDGTQFASNVVTTLDLTGSSLTLIGGDPNPKDFGDIRYGSTTETANWQINIPSSAYGTSQCCRITTTYGEGAPIIGNYCLPIPNLLDRPIVSIYSDVSTICEGLSTVLHSNVTPSGAWNYTWSPSTGLSDPHSPNPTASPISRTTYTLAVTDGIDCSGTSEPLTLYVSPRIIAEAGSDANVYAGSRVSLGGTPTGSGGMGTLEFSWTPTYGISDPTNPNPTAVVYVSTTYYVAVTDTVGCVGIDSVRVNVHNAIGHIAVQGISEIHWLRVIEPADAIANANGVIMVQMPGDVLGAADLVDTLDAFASPVLVNTRFGIRSWRHQIIGPPGSR